MGGGRTALTDWRRRSVGLKGIRTRDLGVRVKRERETEGLQSASRRSGRREKQGGEGRKELCCGVKRKTTTEYTII